ncbi:hypothetical protein [Halarchaeum sp. P4]|uniref:hypothetical protein n=1 Tax=Halarchaeum sp. P4 TaxID=3421639 RepID=UPI003EBB3C2C
MYIDNAHAERTSVVSETHYPSNRTHLIHHLWQAKAEQHRVSTSRLPFGCRADGRREQSWLGERGGVNGRA